MAKDKKEEAADGKGKKKKKPRGRTFLPLFMLVLALVFYPFTIIFIFGLLPAFVAWVVDKRSQKYVGQTVLTMNFCGIFPFVIQLWKMGGEIKDSIKLITDPSTYIWMYGAAAIGWGITLVMPWIVNFTLNINYEDRLRRLQKRQKAIVEEWGTEVRDSAAAPLE